MRKFSYDHYPRVFFVLFFAVNQTGSKKKKVYASLAGRKKCTPTAVDILNSFRPCHECIVPVQLIVVPILVVTGKSQQNNELFYTEQLLR